MGTGRRGPDPLEAVDPGRLSFQILGPLTVLRPDGVRLDLGPRKQRAVLALLLTEAGRVVSLDRIIHGLWADEAPSSATATLQAYVSQLRRILEPDRPPRTPPKMLLTREPGYLLAVRPDQVDAERFTTQVRHGRELIEAGRFDEAQRALTDALALWRGEPLQEFLDEEFTAGPLARLGDGWAAAAEDLADALLGAGRVAMAVDRVREVVERHPYRERAWGQLMLGLYRDGRQAEALAAYRRARTILDQELGLPPGPELRALEASILRHDPALAWRTRTPAPPVELASLATDAMSQPASAPSLTVPPAAERMVGRTAQVAWITERIAAARNGNGGLLLVSGPAGVGKTVLAEVAADLAAREAMTVLRSRCVEGGVTPAFWPWAQIIRSLPADAATAGVLDVLSGRGEAGARAQDPDAGRFELYERVRDLLGTAARRQPVFLSIEDVHVADASSLQLLTHIAGGIAHVPVLVVATLRSEPGGTGPLRLALGALANERGVERVALQPFTPGEVEAYLTSAAHDRPDPDVVRTLHERTGGNPFYLKELLRLIDSEHPTGWGSPQVVLDAAVPESVRDVISRRVARLPEDTQALLRAAAVIGRDVDSALLEATAGIDNERMMGLLEPAVAAGLLVEVPGSWDYRFEHALVRDALYAELSRLQLARIHRRVGEAMETLHRSSDPGTMGRLAEHFAMAARIGAADKAVDYAARAAAMAESQFAYDEAVGFLETALAAVDPTAGQALLRRCQLLIELGRAKRTRGDLIGARAAMEEAVGIARQLGDDGLLSQAATLFGGITMWNWRGYGETDPVMITTLEDLVARLEPTETVRRASLLGTLGVELFYSDRQPDGERYATQAVELARAAGDPDLLVRTLNNYCIAAWVPEASSRRLATVNEILTLTPLPRRAEVAARMHRMMLLIAEGDLAAYDVDLARCRRLVAEIRVPDLTTQVTFAAGGRAIMDGRWAEGERLVDEAFDQHQRTSLWGGQWARLQLLYTSRRFQGRGAELTDEIIARADEPTLELLRSLAVLAACEASDEGRARALLRRWDVVTNRDWSWDIVTFQWGLVAARLGTPDPERLYRALLPYADRFVGVGSSSASWGTNHHVLAELAHRLGRDQDAIGHAHSALSAHRRVGIQHLEAASLAQLEALGGDRPRR